MDVNKEFFSASDHRARETPFHELDPKTQASTLVNIAVRELARVIDEHVPAGRQKSIAFTELESVQMRANRGVFYDG